MMKLAPYRINIAAGLAWLAHGPCQAASPFRTGKPWPDAAHAETLAACAVVLSLLALALLWRHQVLRTALQQAHDRLAAEQALRAGAESALLDRHAKLRQLAATQEQLLQTERRRIAGDIHDDLGQNLLTLKMDISALHANASVPPLLRQQLTIIAANIDLTVRSMRTVIHDLRPVALEHGLRHAVERQLEEFSRISGIRHQLAAAQPAELPDAASAAADCTVFRVLQEMLSNITRHARASEVRVSLCRSAQQLSLTVQDNGIGLRASRPRAGYGLPGIEERVTAAGGCYSLSSVPGQGTVLRIAIPASTARSENWPGSRSQTLVHHQAAA